ncbi:hypothetical protein FHU10_1430 [Serratia fonticola]|uniref:Uncharacterized protein n=1 Tax=Serratia fonticola TaxID=47917 RepID=A0A559T2X4_SERFO|nr:hypothetical protein FHU09_1020 [Serratia fonticola]TQI99442.1 hypothetical protein FHU11_5032 [Serratia fonticola]TVZ68966.1 hypothetical protein FHU10_1430 [Serratia fonticola]
MIGPATGETTAAGRRLAVGFVEYGKQNKRRFSWFLLANCRALYSRFFSLQALKHLFLRFRNRLACGNRQKLLG